MLFRKIDGIKLIATNHAVSRAKKRNIDIIKFFDAFLHIQDQLCIMPKKKEFAVVVEKIVAIVSRTKLDQYEIITVIGDGDREVSIKDCCYVFNV